MSVQIKILDIAIIGAGISGIGTAYWLQKKCPNKTFEIFESRDTIGGTWSLFKYPGIRSDSDMFTFGYRFKPWMKNKLLASGETILTYLNEVIDENNLKSKINFNHKVVEASWSSDENLWTLTFNKNGEIIVKKVRYVAVCAGYYDYDRSYRPKFKGEDNFKGTIAVPQFWPKDLDYTNKKVVIIGSGATAVTILPTMANNGASHVTMLQRSPTYIVPLPNDLNGYKRLKKILPEKTAYNFMRRIRVLLSILFYSLSKSYPFFVKKLIIKEVTKHLPKNYDVKKHFTPTYNPWDQRICIDPNGDFYKSISSGKASVETDTISHFTENGVVTTSGKELTADIIVMATGLNIKLLGGVKSSVDGKPIVIKEHIGYKGLMAGNIPNLLLFFGYTNASWTLRVDLISNYFCKLLNYLDKNNYTYFMPIQDNSIEKISPLEELKSGYFQRGKDEFAMQGKKNPWRAYQNYIIDSFYTRLGKINDGVIKFK